MVLAEGPSPAGLTAAFDPPQPMLLYRRLLPRNYCRLAPTIAGQPRRGAELVRVRQTSNNAVTVWRVRSGRCTRRQRSQAPARVTTATYTESSSWTGANSLPSK